MLATAHRLTAGHAPRVPPTVARMTAVNLATALDLAAAIAGLTAIQPASDNLCRVATVHRPTGVTLAATRQLAMDSRRPTSRRPGLAAVVLFNVTARLATSAGLAVVRHVARRSGQAVIRHSAATLHLPGGHP